MNYFCAALTQIILQSKYINKYICICINLIICTYICACIFFYTHMYIYLFKYFYIASCAPSNWYLKICKQTDAVFMLCVQSRSHKYDKVGIERYIRVYIN